ncbi:hypothetical protein LTR53_013723, partial [Teratosphaeriaceae sp. CCFEE 6253]
SDLPTSRTQSQVLIAVGSILILTTLSATLITILMSALVQEWPSWWTVLLVELASVGGGAVILYKLLTRYPRMTAVGAVLRTFLLVLCPGILCDVVEAVYLVGRKWLGSPASLA